MQGADHAEFAEAGKIFRAHELFVGESVGQAGIAVGLAGGGDAVERGSYGAVADGVDVDDESLLVGGDAELGKFFRIEEQIAVAACVFVGLGEVGGLGGKFDDAVGEDFDPGDVQVGNILVALAGFLHGSEFGRGIFGQHLRKSDDLRREFAVIGEHLVGLQDVLAGQRIEPRGDAEAVVVLEGGAARRRADGRAWAWAASGSIFSVPASTRNPLGWHVFV